MTRTHGPPPHAKPARPREAHHDPEAPPPEAPTARPWLLRLKAHPQGLFWLGVGLCALVGAGLGGVAWAARARQRQEQLRQAGMAGEIASLVASLKAHRDLPFRPGEGALRSLAERSRIRRALALLAAGEENPDADRQAFLEGALAERMRELDQARAGMRGEVDLRELKRDFAEAQRHLEALREVLGRSEATWWAEVGAAFQAAGLPADVLSAAPDRLKAVEAALPPLEEALALALEDTTALQDPTLEVVSFLPDPKRTRLVGDGWGATGPALDGREPGRAVSFTVEGRSLVHRLLNAGTWAGLARVEGDRAGHRHYHLETRTARLGEAASQDTAAALEALARLESAWAALNPLHAGLRFVPASPKACQDILADLEPDLARGTPDGRPDPETWPPSGELAEVKDHFGPGEDLVLLRERQGGAWRCRVLVREGSTYVGGEVVDAERLRVLPGGLLLLQVTREVPAVMGRQPLEGLQVMARPRVKQRPPA